MRKSFWLVLALLGIACARVPAAPPEWKLAWAEEFSYTGPPDPSVWSYEIGAIRNNEAQYYTDRRPENARVENGCLVIESRKEDMSGRRYTSASIHTLHKKSFLYGRIEVRAKIPTGRGSWPAIWAMGTDYPEVNWPACGEIDIMENVGFEPDTIHAAIHTVSTEKKYSLLKNGGRVDIPRPYADFHVYAVDWRPEKIDFLVDGRIYFTYRKDPADPDAWHFDKPCYVILNTAIGGSWGGQKGIDDSIFPLTFLIDYVRYYQGTPASEPGRTIPQAEEGPPCPPEIKTP